MQTMLKATVCVILILFNVSLAYADTRVFFSPDGGCQNAVISEIKKSKASIDIAMYSFTSREIAQALVEAKDRKVRVRIVLDKAQENETYSKGRYLFKRGFDVRYDTGLGLMHNKFAIIDDRVVITGSFNWTASAEDRNEENLLILADQEIIKAYKKRFEYLFGKARKGESNRTSYWRENE
jgi:phosphatidylserine/phosphatidylglycerophosphate/cardiolipin synthase-like enzyme